MIDTNLIDLIGGLKEYAEYSNNVSRNLMLKSVVALTSLQKEIEGIAYYKNSVAELLSDNEGFWHACSGCQEAVEGYVSQELWPHSAIFQCQPGGGCFECGGIGVIWDNIDYSNIGNEDKTRKALKVKS